MRNALAAAILIAFIPMQLSGMTANIMSLGGLALAIGVLVDASIVMVENGYRHLSERMRAGAVSEGERRSILLGAARQVGRPLFFSLVIIVVSFLPVFLLESQEGRMFRPLAWTKTLAISFSSILAITMVPVLMLMLIRGGELRRSSLSTAGKVNHDGRSRPSCSRRRCSVPEMSIVFAPAGTSSSGK